MNFVKNYLNTILSKFSIANSNVSDYSNIFVNIHNKVSETFKKTALTFNIRMSLYRTLETMTSDSAAVPIYEAILELRDYESNKNYKTRLWYVYDDIIQELSDSDKGFSDAVSKYLPQQDVMVLAASEQSDISTGFKTMLENSKTLKKASSAFKAGMQYPLFMVLAFIVTSAVFSLYIIPPYATAIPEGAQLSGISAALLTMSRTFYYWFPALLTLVISAIGFVIWALPNLIGKWRLQFENLPPFNMYRVMSGGAFLFALNSLGKAGYSPNESLTQMSPLSKPYLKERIDLILDAMAESGSDVGEALVNSRLNFPDPKMVKELAIYSKYSDSESALDVLSKTLAEEGVEIIEQQSAVLGRILTFLVFAGIAFLYVGMLTIGNDISSVSSTFK